MKDIKYGVRQAKRDAALESAAGTKSTKAPSPLRPGGALQMVDAPQRNPNIENRTSNFE